METKSNDGEEVCEGADSVQRTELAIQRFHLGRDLYANKDRLYDTVERDDFTPASL